MSSNELPWRERIAASAHEHARNPCYKDRYHTMIRAWAEDMVQEGEVLPDRDHVSITTDTATPLHKKYATLAALHDEFDICDFKFDPWKPQPESNPFRGGDRREFLMFAQYHKLKLYVHKLTDDEGDDLRALLSDVAADLLHQEDSDAGPDRTKVRAAVAWLRDPIVSTVIGGLILAAILAWIGLG